MCGERRNQDGWRNRDANTVQGRSLTLDLQEMTGGDAGEKAFKKHITKGRGGIPQIKVPNGY